MEPDELIQHCFRCKGLMVIEPTTMNRLPSLLYRAARNLSWAKDAAEGIADYGEWETLIADLYETAILLEMVPDD